jgi:drug/metabolite transporter (DMT)-like permease
LTRQKMGLLLVLLSAAGFSSLGIFMKFAYASGANPATILAFRFLFATPLMWLMLRHFGLSVRLEGPLARWLLLYGGLGYTTISVLFALCLKSLPVSLAIMLFYTYPAYVAIIALALGHETLSWQRFTALLVCFVGMFMTLGVSFEGINPTGVLYGLAAALAQAVYTIIGNRILKNVPPLVVTTYVCFAAAAVFLLTGTLLGELMLDLPLAGWGSILALAVLATCIGVCCFFVAISYIGPSNTAIGSMTEPMMAVALSIIVLEETVSASQTLGGAMILAGIFILQLRNGKRGTEYKV